VKRLTAYILVLAFVLLSVAPGFTQDYRQTALDYLTKTLNVPVERIGVFEGHTFTLDRIKESFWAAKYEIYPEGKELPKNLGSEPAGKEQVVPVPPEDKPAVMILPAETRPAPDDYVHGGVYIRLKTGEVLNRKEMEPYFQEDSRLAQAAWEQLVREAGKLDVNLYQKLKEVAVNEKLKVMIVPLFVETPELTARYNALKAEYPEYSKDMLTLTEMFGNIGYGIQRPELAITDGPAVSYPAGKRVAVDLPAVDGGGSTPVFEGSAGKAIYRGEQPTDEYWAKYREFYGKLEAIRIDGLQASLAVIKSMLTAMNIAFENQHAIITAELAENQIEEIADLDAVQTVYEEMLYTTLELRSSAAPDLVVDSAAPPAKTEESAPKGSPGAYLLLLALPLAAGAIFFRKRFAAGSN
jgi:hypothetical protein